MTKVLVLTPEVYSYGSMLIAGALEKAGFRVSIMKFTAKADVNLLPQADVYAIGLYSTLHVLEYKDWISRLKSARDKPVIVGGPVTQIPELVLTNMNCVDAVVVGEGEETIVELVNALISKQDLDSVDGIAYNSQGKVVKTKPREPIDMEKRPMPKIPDDIGEQSIRGAHVYVEVSRGCKGSCSFCQVPRLFGREVRSRPINKIVDEVKLFKKKGALRVAISGGTTSFYGCGSSWLDEKEVVKLLKSLSRVLGPKNLSAPDIRVDAATDGILEAIAKYTIGWVFFGVESGSQKILNKMRKGIKVEEIYDAVYRARKLGVKPAGSFIVAYPGETKENFEETVTLVKNLPLMDHFVSIAEPIPGTPLAEEVADMRISENLLFVNDDSKFGRLYGLSVAESRAYQLMIEGYRVRSPLIIGDVHIAKLFLQEAKKQGEDIRKCTMEVKKLYSLLRGRHEA
ncbi:MAG: TIGR04014 family B12-binding domain/radical SAM domain-containing protein [Thermoproteota archaeon]|jgi:B12-binding domain/radical SAM domain protein|uniref:TIGR04014 family B12-binding domain/radical SAM domain-containing protein n=1 Tax=Candidatus Methanodesulfokora washburnensis TaxID=2478471 RepID=A0A3R9X183_9CREN|nr:methyl-coenzyme M reductase glutamine C-methyltransferase [Candidatus Methanodesulfokores washburnensis]RSN72807.1 TIGR04014 family B12-binding domain/radical SAM domain-containing protein [Candidatus Methanodesulfokores washburnensis]RZN62162.1 MAG: TIGR04014 family B12-binding domain/radical SAM domain-containing protein [Candidatus Methanodesulfokores washburnensis]TDA40589.1 MAG: TIGR04014 family B12-binding domain/radical SAM domain-containing protein [Candidatus Korarchaeota archaeon]